MHITHMDYGPRYLGSAVLAVAIALLAIACRRWSRDGGLNRRLAIVLGSYGNLLMALFILGLIADQGYGWAFVPLMVAAAPWSFLAPIFAHGLIGGWFASGLIGNFVLLVILCGGINNLLLYVVIRTTSRNPDPPVNQVVPKAP